jgi:hypothetical protein
MYDQQYTLEWTPDVSEPDRTKPQAMLQFSCMGMAQFTRGQSAIKNCHSRHGPYHPPQDTAKDDILTQGIKPARNTTESVMALSQ